MTDRPLPAPEEYAALGISCQGATAVDLKYVNQNTTLCAEGVRHRHEYYCLDESTGERTGPFYTAWICGQ